MPENGFSTNTLYGLVYTLIFLDSALFLAWVASIFYLYTECPSTLFNHAIFALYFTHTVAVIHVLSGWNETFSKDPSPIYWLSASILVFFFTLTIFLAQFSPSDSSLGCSYVLLYQILSGTGLSISIISLTFWTVIKIMSRKATLMVKRKKKMSDISDILSTVKI